MSLLTLLRQINTGFGESHATDGHAGVDAHVIVGEIFDGEFRLQFLDQSPGCRSHWGGGVQKEYHFSSIEIAIYIQGTQNKPSFYLLQTCIQGAHN